MPTPLNVLIVEDRPVDAELMLSELRRAGYDPAWRRVDTETDYLAYLHESFDVILADYRLPEFSAVRALQLLKGCGMDIPFLIVSGVIGEEEAVAAMREGATDYLLKDRLGRLGMAVQRALERKRFRDEHHWAETGQRESRAYARQIIDSSLDMIIAVDGQRRITEFNRAAEQTFGYRAEEVLGQRVDLLYADPQQGVAVHQMTVEQGRCLQEVLNRHKDGHVFPSFLSASVVRDARGRIIGCMGVSRDVTERKRSELRLTRKNEELSVLNQISQELGRLRDPAEILPTIRDAVGRLTDTRNLYIALYDEVQNRVSFPIYTVDGSPQAVDDRPFGNGLTEYVIRTGRPVLFAENMEPELARLGIVRTARPARSYIAAPMNAGGKIIGVIALQDYERERVYNDEHVALLATIASAAAIGLENARLYAVLRQELMEREHAETVMRESQARKSAMLETALDCIITFDNEGHIFEWNPAAERAFQRRRVDVLGRPVVDLIIPPSSRQGFRESLAASFEAGAGIALGRRIEMTLQRSDGAEFPAEVAIIRIPLEGAPVFTAYVRDITERRQAEQRLRESEAGLAAAQRVARLGSWELDLDEPGAANPNRLRWSDQMFRIFGYEPGQLRVTEDAFFRAVHADDRQRIRDAVAESLRERKQYSIDHRILLPDGTERILHEHADIVFDRETGRPLKLVGTAQDVTERKRAEEALRHSEEHFRSLIENSSDIITILDATGVIRYVSDSITRLLGYARPQTLTGTCAFDLVHEADRSKALAALERALQTTEAPVPAEVRLRHADGSWREFEAIGKRRRDPSGQAAVVVNLRDIMERRQLESQFRQAQKMESIGQLAGGVAHDFNNILTVIQGHASLLGSAGTLTEDMADSVQQIALAAERAANLTRQLLTFSRKQVMQPRNLDLNEVVNNMSRMLKRILGEDIALHVNCAPALPPIHADAGMVEQVLMNLAVNSRDAMPHGGQLIVNTGLETVDAEYAEHDPDARPGRFVCLSVTDTGSGITRENLVRIFEPFFTTKEVGKGTGLGLATVYGIVQQHEGWIKVYSEIGKGTVFRIYLPAVAVGERPAELKAPSPSVRGGTETILLVEDEAPLRTLVRSILQRHGYNVVEASSGPRALDIWKEHKDRIDLLLTDMVMPEGLNGLELASKLQAEKPSLKVIYSSGYSPDIVGQDLALKEGIDYIQKPYHPRKLAEAIRRALDAPV